MKKWRVACVLICILPFAVWSTGRPESPAPGTPASELPRRELLWYMRGRGPEADQDMVEKIANRYLGPRINAAIRIVSIDRASYPTKLAGIIASGETYDIVFIADWLGYEQYALRGAFAPLNDPDDNLFDTWLPKTKAILGPDYLTGSAVNGTLYAVPVEKEHAVSYGFELRRDLVEKYRMDVSRLATFEDLEPLLKKVKDNEPSIPYPLSAIGRNAEILGWYSPVSSLPAVGYPLGGDHRLYNVLDRPETLRYLSTARHYYVEGFVKKDAASSPDWEPDVLAGKVFAILSVTLPGDDRSMQKISGFPWVEVNMTQPLITSAQPMGAMQAISVTSRDRVRAAMFLELVNTDRYLNNLINFGIEGVHWVRVSENVIDFAPSTSGGKTSGYNPQVPWAFANQRLNYLFPSDDPRKWEAIDAYNRIAVPVQGLGFFPDVSGLTTEMAAIVNVMAEYWPGLDVGSSDPDVFLPLARERLKAAGIDRVIEELQRQYDAWWARKPKR